MDVASSVACPPLVVSSAVLGRTNSPGPRSPSLCLGANGSDRNTRNCLPCCRSPCTAFTANAASATASLDVSASVTLQASESSPAYGPRTSSGSGSPSVRVGSIPSERSSRSGKVSRSSTSSKFSRISTSSISFRGKKPRRPTSPPVPSQLDRVAQEQELCELTALDPTLLRGIRAETLLARCGQVSRKKVAYVSAYEDTAKRASSDGRVQDHASSFQVEMLDKFLSHSWHANVHVKIAALLDIFNGIPAVVVALACAMLFACLDRTGILPPWTMLQHEEGNAWIRFFAGSSPEDVDVSGWALLGYTFGYCFTLLHWQLIFRVLPRFTLTAIFFDKLCINQFDDERKTQGIKSIGAFLIKCKEMLVLWDSTYFSRLWCVFEMAVFLSLNEFGQLRIKSIAMEAYVPVVTMLTLPLFLLLQHLTAIGLLASVLDWVVALGVPERLCLFPFVVVFLGPNLAIIVALNRWYHRGVSTMHQQIAAFKTFSAKCLNESDRVSVNGIICQLYGSEDVFDRFVQTDLLTFVKNSTAAFQTSYTQHLRSVIPFFVYCVDFVLMLDAAGPLRQLHFILGSMILMFLHLPAILAALDFLLTLRLMTRSAKEEVAIVLFMTVCTGAALGLWLCAAHWTLGTNASVKLLSGAAGVFSMLLVWPPLWLCSCARDFCTWARLKAASDSSPHVGVAREQNHGTYQEDYGP